MRITNVTKNAVLADDMRQATTFFTRLRGLLGTDYLPPGSALLIRPCNSVHTFGMKYSLDIVFMNNDNQVIAIKQNMPPGRVAISGRSKFVLELPAGTLASTRTDAGDYLEFSNK